MLFLDEPTSGVDPIARGAFWELIHELSEAGHTIFVSTHYMDEAEYCHRLALMYRGKVIALGSPGGIEAGLKAHLMHLEAAIRWRPCARSKACRACGRRGVRRRAARHGR